MKKIVFFLILLWVGVLLFIIPRNSVEDRGEWVKLKNDIPEGDYILHNNSIYGCTLDSLEKISDIPPLEGVDVPSFEVCKGTSYARDKYRVYYPLFKLIGTYGEKDVYGDQAFYLYFVDYVVKKEILFGLVSINANPKNFKYIKDDYAVDGNTMFRCGQVIEWDENIANGTY